LRHNLTPRLSHTSNSRENWAVSIKSGFCLIFIETVQFSRGAQQDVAQLSGDKEHGRSLYPIGHALFWHFVCPIGIDPIGIVMIQKCFYRTKTYNEISSHPLVSNGLSVSSVQFLDLFDDVRVQVYCLQLIFFGLLQVS
jgi:hypothetical protein